MVSSVDRGKEKNVEKVYLLFTDLDQMWYITLSPIQLARTSHVTQSRFTDSGKYILAKYTNTKEENETVW